ncbi:hypothetical protein [Cupriavidus necator]
MPAYSVVSIADLAHFAGVDPFPSLPKSMRMSPMDLPPPTPHPGEKPARRVAFAWLASGEAVADTPAQDFLPDIVRDVLSLALASAR